MSSPYIGQIILVGFNFAPQGWAFCNGALLAISEQETLFNLIGTTYGGDGQTTFALPDLRGRVPVHVGQGPGLSSYVIGQAAGVENVTLNVNQLPQHAHVVSPAASSGEQTSNRPDNNFPAVGGYYATSLAVRRRPATRRRWRITVCWRGCGKRMSKARLATDEHG